MSYQIVYIHKMTRIWKLYTHMRLITSILYLKHESVFDELRQDITNRRKSLLSWRKQTGCRNFPNRTFLLRLYYRLGSSSHRLQHILHWSGSVIIANTTCCVPACCIVIVDLKINIAK